MAPRYPCVQHPYATALRTLRGSHHVPSVAYRCTADHESVKHGRKEKPSLNRCVIRIAASNAAQLTFFRQQCRRQESTKGRLLRRPDRFVRDVRVEYGVPLG